MCVVLSELECPLLPHSDEDMQSLASLMSVKPTDIGNLDDFNESDEDEERKPAIAAGRPREGLHLHCRAVYPSKTPGAPQRAAYLAPCLLLLEHQLLSMLALCLLNLPLV